MISASRRQIIHLLPGFLARRSRSPGEEGGEKYLGASVRRVGASIVVGIKESVTYETAPKPLDAFTRDRRFVKCSGSS